MVAQSDDENDNGLEDISDDEDATFYDACEFLQLDVNEDVSAVEDICGCLGELF